MSKKAKRVKVDDHASDSKEDAAHEKSHEDSQSEDENSEGEELQLNVTEDGRVICGGELNYQFQSFPQLLKLGDEQLATTIKDCEAVFKIRAKRDRSGYSLGETFWLGAADAPRCAIEEYVQQLFRFHTRNAVFDPSDSGGEWWTQVIEKDDDIGFHWDKDYALEHSGINLCPHLASVTYLNNIGGPTCILDHVTPLTVEDSLEGRIESAHVSVPVIGKHITFDGRLLHGSVGSLARHINPAAGEKRVTLLVNIWLNHKPLTAVTAPESVVTKLQTPLGTLATLDFDTTEEPVAIDVNDDSNLGRESWEISSANGRARVTLPDMNPLLAPLYRTHACFLARLNAGCAANVVMLEDSERNDDDEEDSEEDDEDDEDDEEYDEDEDDGSADGDGKRRLRT